jgi:hypothetical protein
MCDMLCGDRFKRADAKVRAKPYFCYAKSVLLPAEFSFAAKGGSRKAQSEFIPYPLNFVFYKSGWQNFHIRRNEWQLTFRIRLIGDSLWINKKHRVF